MSDPIPQLLRKYRRRGLLIDTNILLLYFVGQYNPRLIGSFKRTQQFMVDDFERLLRIVGWFKKVVTTPNILTEVSNLAGQLPANQAREWRVWFRSHI